LDAGQVEACLKLLLKTYGPEILGFLRARPGPESLAEDAFMSFTQDVWRGLPQWQPRGALRAWLYTLARNAWIRTARKQSRADRVGRALGSAVLEQAVAEVRSHTRPYMRTDVKDQFQALRARLAEPDQTLLVLRVDRGLDWWEIAQVLGEDDGAQDEEAASRAAARLRQRFRTLKVRLARMARDAGLLDE